MSSVLSIQQLSKSYGPVKALNHISFEVPEGSVFGVLGPNGSGKTTLLGILLDVLLADRGDFQWFGGMPHQAARKRIGALLETPNFYHYLSAVQNLKINTSIKEKGTDDIDRVLQLVRLAPRKHARFNTYSLGMKQRLAIGNALLGRPKVLLLDEPTNGLDPEGIAEIRALIKSLNKQGITIIMASHLLDEVEKVCTHVAVLKQGHLLGSGPVKEVFQSEDILEVSSADNDTLKAVLSGLQGVVVLQAEDLLQVSMNGALDAAMINEYCYKNGITLSYLNLKRKSLEAQFMELTRTDDSQLR